MNKLILALVALAFASGAGPAQATLVKLQFDMGGGSTPATETDSSPGLASGAFTGADTTWNRINTTLTNYTSLKYSDGSTATGVTAQLGSSGGQDSSTTFTWNSATSVNAVGFYPSDAGHPIYFNNLMTGNLLYTPPSGPNAGFGLRVSGLGAGTYDVYVISVHPAALNIDYNIGIGTNLAQQVASPTVINANGTADTWIAGKNYALGRVIINSTTDWVSMITSGSNYPEIGGIQIAQVIPEPASFGLFVAGGAMLALRRRRH